MVDYVESSAQFRFRFDGENDIAAESLVGSINNMIDLISTATNDMDSSAYAKLRIQTVKPGSFEIDLQAIVACAVTLMPAIDLATTVLKLIVSVFELKKHLKGKPPKEISEKIAGFSVTNNAGEEKIFHEKAGLFFNKPKYDNCVVNIFNIAQGEEAKGLDLAVRDMSVIEKRDISVHVGPEEFKEMSVPIVDVIEPAIRTREHTVKKAQLIIKKPDLIGNSQWGFRYDNASIDAPIQDNSWLEAFQKEHQPLMSGSILIADLRMVAKIDEQDEDIPDTAKYYVTKVYGIINPKEQVSIEGI
jgi:hypothetical protein